MWLSSVGLECLLTPRPISSGIAENRDLSWDLHREYAVTSRKASETRPGLFGHEPEASTDFRLLHGFIYMVAWGAQTTLLTCTWVHASISHGLTPFLTSYTLLRGDARLLHEEHRPGRQHELLQRGKASSVITN